MGDVQNLSTSTAVFMAQEATGCSPISFGDGWRSPAQALTVLGIVLASAGTTVSAVALAVVTSARLPNRGLRLGLLSLSAADMLFALTTIAQLSFVYYWEFDGSGGHKCGSGNDTAEAERGEQQHRREWCAVNVIERMWDVATTANQLTLVFLAVQQFAIIRWPLHYRDGLPAGCCSIVLVVAWVASAVAGLAPLVVVVKSTDDYPDVDLWPTKGTTRFCYQVVLYDYKNDSCGLQWALPFGQGGHQHAIVAFGAALTGVVLVFLGVSYGYLIAVVRHTVSESYRSDCRNWEVHTPLAKQPPTEHSVQLRTQQSQQQLPRQQQHRKQQKQQQHQLHEGERTRVPLCHHSARRAVAVTALVTAACTVCYMPLYVFHVLNHYYKDECSGCRHPVLYPVLLALACSAPLVDPLIYTLRLKPLRDSALRRLAKYFCRPGDANRRQCEALTAVTATAVHRPAIGTHLPAAVDQQAWEAR